MKTIEIDDELYQYLVSRTQTFGETPSDVLRRLLRLPSSPQPFALVQPNVENDELKTKRHHATDIEKTVQRVEKVLKSDLFVNETKNVSRFLQLLSALHRANPEQFAKATENVQGNERLYFARSEQDILKTGSSVKAKLIPDSPFWVITNNNTARKGIILAGVMESMQLPKHLIERVQALFL